MFNIFTGIQSTGSPHLGNILGSIVPALELSKNPKYKGIFFIADLHSLTSIKNPSIIQENTFSIAAAWIAMGLNPEKCIFFRQSKIPEVCELKWYLDCFAPFPMLSNSHAFKEKSKNLSNVNAGLFTYPVLMAADILLYNSHFVPVGRDQKQHIEITRDIAKSFNTQYHEEIFSLPEAKLYKEIFIPGTDGNKMSKSYKNTIDIFAEEKLLKKQIMSIKTDSTPLNAPKDYTACNIFKIYKLFVEDNNVMKEKYTNGKIGYGDIKKELFEIILEKYEKERIRYNELINNKKVILEILTKGELKAKDLAAQKIDKIRKILHF